MLSYQPHVARLVCCFGQEERKVFVYGDMQDGSGGECIIYQAEGCRRPLCFCCIGDQTKVVHELSPVAMPYVGRPLSMLPVLHTPFSRHMVAILEMRWWVLT